MANTFLSGRHNSVWPHLQGKKVKPADADDPQISGLTAAGSPALPKRGKGERNCISCLDTSLPARMVCLESKSTNTVLVTSCCCRKQQGMAEKEGNSRERTTASLLLFGRKHAFLCGTLTPTPVPQKKLHLLDYQEQSKDTSMHYRSSTKST